MPKKILKKEIKQEEHDEDDTESFHNSEDDYTEIENSQEELNELSGGDSELGDDSSNIDIDADDLVDPDRDEKYDPINDNREDEDPETIEELEEEVGEYESANSENEPDADEDNDIREDDAGEEGEYAGETKQCHLKNLNKDFIVLDEDDSNMYGKMEYKKIPQNERETDAIMTYYEMVRIIGTRAQQFNFGAPPLVKGLDGLHSAKKAYLELIAKMTPFIIRRHLPGKKYEEWRVDELEIIHSITDSFFVPENFDYYALMNQGKEFNKNTESTSASKSTSASRSASRINANKNKLQK